MMSGMRGGARSALSKKADRTTIGRSVDRIDIGLVSLAVAVRVGYWVVFERHYTPLSDANHYDGIARNLAAGLGFSHRYPALARHSTAFRPPGFPSLLGALYTIFGARVAVGQCLNLALGVVVVLLVRRVASEVGGPAAGIAAASLVAIYPPLVANDVVLLSEPLGLCLLLGAILCLLRNHFTAGAVLSGLLCLTWTSGQGFLLVVAVWVLVQVGWRKAVRFALVGMAVVLPWVIRNEIQVGTPLLVTSNGFNLAAVYSPEAQHTHRLFVDPVFNKAFGSWQFRLAQFHEAGWDRELRQLAWQGIKANPVHVVWVGVHNAARLVEASRVANATADRLDGRNLTLRHDSLPLFYVVTGVGMVGIWRFRRSRAMQLLVLLACCFSAASVFTVFSPRLRAVFDLTCCIAAGALVAQLVGRSSPPRATATALPRHHRREHRAG